MRRGVVTAIAGALALVFAACSSGPGALPKVPDFTPASTTTTELDYSNVGLRGVTGRTPTTAVVVGPGQATLSGTVTSEQGAVAGAKVNIERIVGTQTAQLVLLTGQDGSWSAPKIQGGRYRIRSWRAPDLAQTTATTVFLERTETRTIELRVRTIDGVDVSSSMAPETPRTDRDTNLVVLVAHKTVDDDGIVRAMPIAAQRVDLIGSGGWFVRSSNPTFTDGQGHADWLLRCRSSGRQPLAVSVDNETFPLTINNCFDPDEEPPSTTIEETPAA